MLESAYDPCLAYELLQKGLRIERQKPMPLVYRGQVVDVGYRTDLLVEGLVVVEVKAVECLDAHSAQLLSYLKLSGCTVGLLLNFNVKWLAENGIKRIVNGFPE